MRIFRDKKIYVPIIILAVLFIIVFTRADAQVSNTIRSLPMFTSTTTPFEAITTRIFGKDLYLPNSNATTSALEVTGLLRTANILPDGNSTRDIGSSLIRYANGFFDNLDATTILIGGASAGDFDMGGFQILNVGTTTGTHFIATSTTATSTFAGGLTIETSGFVYDFSTNRVGIGTASPNRPLEVLTNTADTPQFRVAFDTQQYIEFLHRGYFNIVTTAPSVNHYQFQEGGSVSMVIKEGNVGIGTSSPFAKLSVHGLSTDSDTGQLLFAIASSTASATTTHFVVTNEGRVGIGTASPAQRFHMVDAGGANLRITGGTGGAGFQFQSEAAATTHEFVQVFMSTASIFNIRSLDENLTNAELAFTIDFPNGITTFNPSGLDYDFIVESDTSTHALFVQGSDGFVGIGSSTPSEMLSIESTTGAVRILLKSGDAATSFGGNGNPSGANSNIYTFNAFWDNTFVAQMRAVSGADTVNKDDGYLIFGAAQGGTLVETARFGESNSGNVIFNESGLDHDFRVEGDTITNLLFVNAGTDRIGVDTNAPNSLFQIGTENDSTDDYIQIDSEAGAPPSGDCNADAESGRMILDHTNDRLYVCNQLSGRGWDFIGLTD